MSNAKRDAEHEIRGCLVSLAAMLDRAQRLAKEYEQKIHKVDVGDAPQVETLEHVISFPELRALDLLCKETISRWLPDQPHLAERWHVYENRAFDSPEHVVANLLSKRTQLIHALSIVRQNGDDVHESPENDFRIGHRGPIEIFFSYAHDDEDLMNDVRRQLIVYERNGRILKWHDRMIPAGTDWRKQLDHRLERADIVLLFISPHFIESRYCYEVEGKIALERCQAGRVLVVPIILRPCAWEDTPFGNLQALPRDGRPITRWQDRDEACLDVARGVMKLVDSLTMKPG